MLTDTLIPAARPIMQSGPYHARQYGDEKRHTSASSSASSSQRHDRQSILGTSSTTAPGEAGISIGEQLMQVDQEITLTLQEIDANFAQSHQIITSRILPAIKRYGIASHNTWQGAKFWHRFFETASDIHLAPPRAEQLDDSQQSTSYEAESTSQLDDNTKTVQLQRKDSGDEDDEENEADPPRLSDASIAATARLGAREGVRNSSGAFTGAEDEGLFDESAEMEETLARLELNGRAPRHPSSQPQMSNKDRTSSSSRPGSALPKVLATPRRGAKAHNPFVPATASAAGEHAGSKQGQPSTSSPHWNGIADLRNTPLVRVNEKGQPRSKEHGKKSRSGHNAAYHGLNDDDADEDSLAWPAGMSPPVTMQFSVPRSRYNKTPAKEAAKLVVDDLLRTVEGTTPAALRRLVLEREAKGKAPSVQGAPKQTSMRKEAVDRLGTRPTKGRQSMPTPPTITKRIGPSHSNLDDSRRKASQQRESTPKSSSAELSTRLASGSSRSAALPAARLIDEDEEGQSVLDATAGADAAYDEHFESRLAKMQLSSKAMDDMLLDDDEEDSDNDLYDSDEDEEEEAADVQRSRQLPNLSVTRERTSLARALGKERAAGLTASSISHSIDEDTLFGIRDPSENDSAFVSASSQRGYVPAAEVTYKTDAEYALSGTSAKEQEPFKAANVQTPSAHAFKPLGHVQSMGTVHRGRPLVEEERDFTYSAPSPTPMHLVGKDVRK